MMQKLIDRVNLVSREMLTGLSVVRAFDRQQYEEERFDKASTALYRTQLFTNRAMGIHDAHDDVGHECCFGSYRVGGRNLY